MFKRLGQLYTGLERTYKTVVMALVLVGLVGALLGDGAWDWIGSALLATTVAAVAWALVRSWR